VEREGRVLRIVSLARQTLSGYREVKPGVGFALPGSKIAHLAQRVDSQLSVTGFLSGLTRLVPVVHGAGKVIKIEEVGSRRAGHTAVDRQQPGTKHGRTLGQQGMNQLPLRKYGGKHRPRSQRILLPLTLPKHSLNMVDDPSIYPTGQRNSLGQALLLVGV
jgi:hypothetical protein